MSKKAKVIPRDVMEKVLLLNCRKDENVRRLEKSLMKLPVIKSKEDLVTDKLEEIVKRIERKYPIHLSYIMRNVVNMDDYYSGSIKSDTDSIRGAWIKTIYGVNIREVLMKTIFFMFYYISTEKKRGKVRNKNNEK